MKKIISSGIVILSFILYLAFDKGFFSEQNRVLVTPPASLQQADPTTSVVGATPPPVSQSKPAPTPPAPKPPVTTSPPPVARGKYVDGSYTGQAADAFYGLIQVQAIITGGKISDVIFLQYPSDRSQSRYINSQAMPYLKAEAIQVQSANVDIVSGATASSEAFQQSLASALSQAL